MRLASLALVCAIVMFIGRPERADGASWLVVSDIHYNPLYHPASHPGSDTQRALLDSLFGALRAAEPHPQVVIIPGDFLAHGFYGWDAAPTMRELARRFDRTFPGSQFVITLGNNDSDCGDYEITPGGAFLRAVAQAWAPLVDRNGAAPGFMRTFARDGSYVASLPIPKLRAVVVNDVYWSPRYRNRCGRGSDPTLRAFSELRGMLRAGSAGSHNWLVLHIPPGIDVFSTQFTRGLFVVPFLSPDADARLQALVDDPANHVALVLAAHSHKFAYRLIGAGGSRPVPVLLAPSVSPIFYNAPSFLRIDVDGHGTIRNATEFSFDWKRWRAIGGLNSLGVERFTGPDLLELQRRMERNRNLRQTFARLYDGAGSIEITDANWRYYLCAATVLSTAPYAACARSARIAQFTPWGLRLGALLALILLVALVAFVTRNRQKTA
jgi:hypothetical protein